MEVFPYTIENGLCMIQIGEKSILVSTGVPESMCTCGEFILEDKHFKTKPQSLRLTPPQLSTEIGLVVEGVLGADLLTRFDYRFNPFRQEFWISQEEIHPYGYAYHFDLYRSVPVVSVWIESRETKVFFNTGSKHTLLVPEIATRFPQVDVAKVFYPGIGWYETPLYRILIWMSGNDVELDVGLPHPSLLPMLQSNHAKGVLGCDVLQGPGVFLASRRREVIWFWHDY
jgi:hypothetical protein